MLTAVDCWFAFIERRMQISMSLYRRSLRSYDFYSFEKFARVPTEMSDSRISKGMDQDDGTERVAGLGSFRCQRRIVAEGKKKVQKSIASLFHQQNHIE